MHGALSLECFLEACCEKIDLGREGVKKLNLGWAWFMLRSMMAFLDQALKAITFEATS